MKENIILYNHYNKNFKKNKNYNINNKNVINIHKIELDNKNK